MPSIDLGENFTPTISNHSEGWRSRWKKHENQKEKKIKIQMKSILKDENPCDNKM